MHLIGQRIDAAICYTKALECQANHVWAHTNISNLHLEAGELIEALHFARRATALDSSNDMAWNNCGAALARLNLLEEAVTCLETAVKRNPNNAIAWCNLGACRLQLGDPSGAKTCFSEALDLDPNLVAARQMLRGC